MEREWSSFSEDGTAGDEEEILLPLEAGVFTINIGLPVIVICNKSDATAMLENDHDYRNEHFDFIQMSLRKACLQYGAALVYSGKDKKTRELLLRYINHRAFGFPLAAKVRFKYRIYDVPFVVTL